MHLRNICLLVFCFLNYYICAQNENIWLHRPALNVSGFLEVFYVYDFNQPKGTKRQSFLFNHNRYNEINLNLGFIKIGLEHSKYRANIALQAGTYCNDNYSAEPGVLKNIFEANAGISLNKKNNLWFDAGVFASHIGFESPVAVDNWTLTRSLLADNSPYFLSGGKLTYHSNQKWIMAVLILNGWQRIQRLEGNSLPSMGTQVIFRPTEKVTYNWSTFIGTDDPDTTRRMRYFNNLYVQFLLNAKLGLIAGFDIGTQQKAKNSSSYEFWFSPVMIMQYALNKKWKMAIRAEYYHDKTGIIILTNTPTGFKTSGASLNIDYSPTKNFLCRLEGRWLNSKDKIFEAKNMMTNHNFIVATSIAISFLESINKK